MSYLKRGKRNNMDENILKPTWYVLTTTPFYVDNQKTLHEDHLKPNISCSHQTYWNAIPLY